ncbi:MAG TPA: Fur family transcriptional regulator [Acidimicrobiales bacterium]|jgi:Fe2+ or Zn2+ uptake regulation protein|nr:Fur family transcriptional regulator [Acidimicrobiales bacterium]
MSAFPDVHDVAAARLRRLEQRYTRARRALVGVLASAEAPLSIPQLLAREPVLAQSSAYRNLGVLEQAGVVHRIVGSDEFSRYELAEDLTEHHHHLICSACGEVQDFTAPASIEDDLERALHRVAAQHGFDADHHRLDLVGTCANCR